MTRMTVKMAAMFTMTRNEERECGNGCSRHASDATHAQCE